MPVPSIAFAAIPVASGCVRRVVPAWVAVVSLLSLAGLSLTGCGTVSEYDFAPPCPTTGVVADAADVVRFRANARGPSQDLTDMVVSGRITGLRGRCSREDSGREKVVVTVLLTLTRGPALTGRTVSVPYFLSVSEGTGANSPILAREEQVATAEFPANIDQVQYTSAPVTLSLPTTKEKSGAVFDVLAGFQLTPQELAYNRTKGAR